MCDAACQCGSHRIQNAVVASSARGHCAAVGDNVPYMVRSRAPMRTILGPIIKTGSNKILLQAEITTIPTDYSALLYLGGRSDHPTKTCTMASDTSASVYAINEVSSNTASTTTIRSAPLTPIREHWSQLTEHMAVGSLVLGGNETAVPLGEASVEMHVRV